jgi:uncharacterized radical SAM superfamily protein
MAIGDNLKNATPSIFVILKTENRKLALDIWVSILKENNCRWLTKDTLEIVLRDTNGGADYLRFCYDLWMNIHH